MSPPGCRDAGDLTVERPSSAVDISVMYLRTSIVLRPFRVECEIKDVAVLDSDVFNKEDAATRSNTHKHSPNRKNCLADR
jgi:hypothetical protein